MLCVIWLSYGRWFSASQLLVREQSVVQTVINIVPNIAAGMDYSRISVESETARRHPSHLWLLSSTAITRYGILYSITSTKNLGLCKITSKEFALQLVQCQL